MGMGKHDVIDPWWQIMLYQAERFPQRAFPAVAYDCSATFACYGKP